MFRNWLLCLALILPSCLYATETRVMAEGQTLHLAVPAGSTIWVSDGKVIKVKDQGPRLLVHAKKVGTALIDAGTRSYQIHVLTHPHFEFHKTLTSTLKSLRGLELKIKNQSLQVEGQLLRFSDWKKLAAVAHPQAKYAFAAQLSMDLKKKAQVHFQKLFSKTKLPAPKWSWNLPIEAHVSPQLKPSLFLYEKALQPYGIQVNVDESQVTPAPLVRLRVLIAELKKSSKQALGISWSSAYEAQVLPELLANQPLTVALNALEEKGLGKVLASPHLLCRSGGQAEFLAGGEFPIRIVGYKARTIEWKKHGVLLKFEPQADYDGNMSIKLTTEISLIDEAVTVDGLPGMKTNRISSHFDIAGKRTIALSGLLQSQLGQSRSGLPYLSQIPILGRLFSSPQYQSSQTELVVFITPEVLSPTSHQDPMIMPEEWNDH